MPRSGTTGVIASLVFFAIGAIMALAITDTISGVDLKQIGFIVMGISALGFVLSLGAFLMSERGREAAPADVEVRERRVIT